MKAIGVILAIGTLCASHSASAQVFGRGPMNARPDLLSNSVRLSDPGRVGPAANQYYLRGYKLFEAGKYREAALLFERAANDGVWGNSQMKYMAGATNYLIGDDDKARKFLKASLVGSIGTLSSKEREMARKMLADVKES